MLLKRDAAHLDLSFTEWSDKQPAQWNAVFLGFINQEQASQSGSVPTWPGEVHGYLDCKSIPTPIAPLEGYISIWECKFESWRDRIHP